MFSTTSTRCRSRVNSCCPPLPELSCVRRCTCVSLPVACSHALTSRPYQTSSFRNPSDPLSFPPLKVSSGFYPERFSRLSDKSVDFLPHHSVNQSDDLDSKSPQRTPATNKSKDIVSKSPQRSPATNKSKDIVSKSPQRQPSPNNRGERFLKTSQRQPTPYISRKSVPKGSETVSASESSSELSLHSSRRTPVGFSPMASQSRQSVQSRQSKSPSAAPSRQGVPSATPSRQGVQSTTPSRQGTPSGAQTGQPTPSAVSSRQQSVPSSRQPSPSAASSRQNYSSAQGRQVNIVAPPGSNDRTGEDDTPDDGFIQEETLEEEIVEEEEPQNQEDEDCYFTSEPGILPGTQDVGLCVRVDICDASTQPGQEAEDSCEDEDFCKCLLTRSRIGESPRIAGCSATCSHRPMTACPTIAECVAKPRRYSGSFMPKSLSFDARIQSAGHQTSRYRDVVNTLRHSGLSCSCSCYSPYMSHK